jgi:pectinesterase
MDPQGVGAAYGELLFQHSFAAGENTATFSVEKTETVAPPFPAKAFARFVPERLDDFAWENDKVGHRTYGPALAAPAEPGSGKEVLVTSGLDVWFKRVEYPIVDRWYNKGHTHYHKDEGEGLDMYDVGTSRGCGGTGIWNGATLFTSRNFKSWKVIANGPVRAIFELSYDGWDAGGTRVSEVKRFAVDAGHQLDQIDSTFTFDGPAQLTVAIGLNKAPVNKKQEPKLAVTRNRDEPSLVQWVELASNGAIGTAIVLPAAAGFAEDPLNHLILAPVTSGKPLRYYAGAAWTRAGQINSSEEWKAYVAAAAARLRHPVRVRLDSQ